jgi:HD superfamily phosphohydrolase
MREQAYRDPVHGFILVNGDYLLQLIDTPEFQRLRRIRQLGVSYGTYHGAEHSRFGHSLGTMWIMQQMLDRLEHAGFPIASDVRITALCAALLHDVGHGPFSHALENLLTCDTPHEEWSQAIVTGDTEINRVLRQVDEALPQQVADVLASAYAGPAFVQELVSSQLDADRMDYLLRDSLYTGVTYGHFDLHRLINTLQLMDEHVVIQAKGIVAIEEYVLARYFMYWQVYYHKAIRSQELLLQAAWRRAMRLWQEGRLQAHDVTPGLVSIMNNQGLAVEQFLQVDDYDVYSALKQWRHHTDTILADLSGRFLDRRLLKPIFKAPHSSDVDAQLEQARELVKHYGWDPDYYLQVDHTRNLAYDTYTEAEESAGHMPTIKAVTDVGKPVEVTKLSEPIRAVAQRPREAVNVYVPQDVVAQVRALFTGS